MPRKPKTSGRDEAAIEVTDASPAESKAEPGGTQAIDRALSVLFAFTPEQPTQRVPDLTRLLDLNKSTVYRLLQALGAVDLVRRDEESGAYRLGPAVLDLASCFLSTIDLGVEARPILQAFAIEHGESVNMAVIDGTDAVRVDNVRGSKMPQLVSSLGLRIPIYCSAAGKALVFDHTDEQLHALLRRSNLQQLTEHTIVDADSFVQRLHRERKQGWALNDEESEIGMRVIGVPIRDHANVIVAAVSVSAPTFRLSNKAIPALAQAVCQMAAKISAALGAHESGSAKRGLPGT